MSKGEVERIWIPFMPWLLLAGVALVPTVAADAPRAARSVPVAGWLALQAATAIALECLVRTPW
jgi:hypothetical protein